jgi:hypothetical protein
VYPAAHRQEKAPWWFCKNTRTISSAYNNIIDRNTKERERL